MRMLVVEDSAKMAALLRKGLQREGYAVDITGSGQDAIWMAGECDYDVIVLDIILEAGEPDTGGPAVDGFDVCRRIRASGCRTPVLMVTARGAVHDRVHGLDTGADDYLTKPFSLAELLARIRALLRRGPVARSVVLRVGDLSLDPARRAVDRDGAAIALTPTEFALLEYLMRHQGTVVPRAALIAHVWDFAFDGDPRILNTYLRSLREKVDRPFGRASLQTVRGVGYRIIDETLGAAAD